MQSLGVSTSQQTWLRAPCSPARPQKGYLACVRPSMRRNNHCICAAAAPETSEQKIRIKLKAYELPLLKQSVKEILRAAEGTEADVSGPVPLPTRIRKYTVLRSPHVNKDSREQFEVRTHQRLIDIRDPSAATIDSLMGLDLPAGVDVQVKLQ